MAHEIMEHDGLVLTQKEAWHGLGTLVENAPTPSEALKIAGLDWTVAQYPLVAVKAAADGDSKGMGLNVPGYRANYRTDCDIMLGMVTENYVPIQNQELADFCEALAQQGDTVRVETAGSIRNGQKLWFLLRGESFSVRRQEDEVVPYYCVSNGHDGLTAMRCTPTTVRVVCSNTLHMVIPRGENERSKSMGQAAFKCHHTRLIKQRVEEAKAALGLYGKALEKTKELMDVLSANDANTAKAQDFFLKCYTKDFEPIPTNPKDKKEADAKFKAEEAYAGFMNRVEKERTFTGMVNMWTLFNAYTGYLQNDRPTNLLDPDAANESRTASKLFGKEAERAHSAFAIALSIAS